METQAALYTGSNAITPEDLAWSWGHLVSLFLPSHAVDILARAWSQIQGAQDSLTLWFS